MSRPMPPSTLDGNPPSPGSPQPQQPTLQQVSPADQLGGNMQVAQIFMQSLAQAAKLIDLCGQVNPPFAPTAQMIIEQLKGGARSSLQQGMAPTGAPSLSSLAGGSPAAAAPSGPAQAPPPMLPSGM